ncbi:MAG: hypothetical protein AB1Z57_05285 [Acidimicrobiia bacterium]
MFSLGWGTTSQLAVAADFDAVSSTSLVAQSRGGDCPPLPFVVALPAGTGVVGGTVDLPGSVRLAPAEPWVREVADPDLRALTNGSSEAMALEVSAGRTLTPDDHALGRRVVVVGAVVGRWACRSIRGARY